MCGKMKESNYTPKEQGSIEPEPIIPYKVKKNAKLVGKILAPWAGVAFAGYIFINAFFGYLGVTSHMQDEPDATQASIEQKLEDLFEKYENEGRFVYKISKPGREIAYFFNLKNK